MARSSFTAISSAPKQAEWRLAKGLFVVVRLATPELLRYFGYPATNVAKAVAAGCSVVIVENRTAGGRITGAIKNFYSSDLGGAAAHVAATFGGLIR